VNINVTYFLDVTSSWCVWAEPAWAAARKQFADRATFDWQISLIPPEGFAASRAQCDWFYRRSGTIAQSPFMLNSGWMEPERKGYPVPNLVAEAARSLGAADDRVRLALAEAGMREGRKIGRWEEAVAIGAAAGKLDPVVLRQRAESPEIDAVIQASTKRFHEFKMTQRPTFLIENGIGDRAVLSGTWTIEPLAAVIESQWRDSASYAVHATHFGAPPSP
jgi:predicted DsbA family dithiol-disulfide isomerase